jgi:hypothetical protein
MDEILRDPALQFVHGGRPERVRLIGVGGAQYWRPG